MSFLTRTACGMIIHDITTKILVTLEFPKLWTNLNLRLQKGPGLDELSLFIKLQADR